MDGAQRAGRWVRATATRPVYQNYSPPYGSTTVVVLPPQKSVGLAFILTFFFGPLGMLYSTVSGAMIMMGVRSSAAFSSPSPRLGLGLVLYWPLVWVASIVWGCVAAGNQQAPHVMNTYR